LLSPKEAFISCMSYFHFGPSSANSAGHFFGPRRVGR
jgi:hypothetical protein